MVTTGNENVGVGVIVNVGVIVGVKVMVGVSVSVKVGVKVGVNVDVGGGVSVHESAMAVSAVAVCVSSSSGEKLPRLQLRRKSRRTIAIKYFFM